MEEGLRMKIGYANAITLYRGELISGRGNVPALNCLLQKIVGERRRSRL